MNLFLFFLAGKEKNYKFKIKLLKSFQKRDSACGRQKVKGRKKKKKER